MLIFPHGVPFARRRVDREITSRCAAVLESASRTQKKHAVGLGLADAAESLDLLGHVLAGL